MTLQIAEGAVVAQDVEPILRSLPRTTGLVPPVRPHADARGEHRVPVVGMHPPDEPEELVVRQIALGVEHGRGDLQLALGIMVNQVDFFARLGLDVAGELGGQLLCALAHVPPVARPGHAPIVHVDTLEELGDDLPQLDLHQVAVLAHLGERMLRQAHQELLVGLAGRVDPEVRARPGREDQPERVAGLRQDRLAIHEVGVTRRLRESLAVPGIQGLVHPPVRREDIVQQFDVVFLELGFDDLGRDGRAPTSPRTAVVAHVPRRLFEVRREPAPLQRLRQELRRLLAGQVDAAELRHRIVAVLHEDAVVQLLGPC